MPGEPTKKTNKSSIFGERENFALPVTMLTLQSTIPGQMKTFSCRLCAPSYPCDTDHRSVCPPHEPHRISRKFAWKYFRSASHCPRSPCVADKTIELANLWCVWCRVVRPASFRPCHGCPGKTNPNRVATETDLLRWPLLFWPAHWIRPTLTVTRLSGSVHFSNWHIPRARHRIEWIRVYFLTPEEGQKDGRYEI